MKNSIRVAALAAIVCAAGMSIQARQAPVGPSFEVASIKANNSGSGNASIRNTGGRFSATNVTVMQLVRAAYSIQDFQIEGQPGWFDGDRFDVEAKAEDPNASSTQLLAMVQNLLADRFKLSFHKSSKDVTVLALIVGKNGSKMKAYGPDCAPDASANCGSMNASAGQTNSVNGSQVTMDQLATRLSRSLGQTVVNRTSLAGRFDVKLEWVSDEIASAEPNAGASIFAAVQEQLGLRLESQKAPVETFVIDRVEKPAPIHR